MAESTDTFGIPFPCEGELVTCSSLTGFALAVDNALSTVNTLATSAIAPPTVSVQNEVGQTINAGVTTTLTYPTELYDRGNLFNPASPTLVTLPFDGSYLATLKIWRFSSAGNIFSFRGAILRAGTEVASHKDESIGSGEMAALITMTAFFQGTAGQTVTTTSLFTGTVTINMGQYFTVSYISSV
jgi:hypothetical protein